MKCHVWIEIFVSLMIAAGRGACSDPQCCEPLQKCFIDRLAPGGGWHPYGGGLLDWWNPCCFPRCGAPDDYCRKPLPRVCWPPYPPYYIWGPPQSCHRQDNGTRYSSPTTTTGPR
jgi:hypothetical protein